MKPDLRHQLETIAESGLRSHPADARHALNLGMKRYRQRIGITFSAMFAATLISTGALLTFHHPIPELEMIVVSAGSPVIQPKSSLQLTVKGTYSDGTTKQLTTDIVWASSRSAVATVDTSGKVAGIRPGSTTITAAREGVQGSITLTVSKAKLSTISVAPKLPSVEAGKQLQLIAEGTYNDRSKAKLASPPVAWKSNNPEVATVDKTGLTSGAKPGSTTITATLEGVRASVTLKVTAPPPPPSGSTPPTSIPPVQEFGEILEGAYLHRNFLEVVAELKAIGFLPVTVARPSDTIAMDLVISVTPNGRVQLGASITVTYSSGPTTPPSVVVVVPDCKGQAYAFCQSEISALGLIPQGTPTDSAEAPGVVLDLQPVAGTEVPLGSTVVIVYSAGTTSPTPPAP